MLIFFIFFSFVVAQRLIELYIAKRNEKWMLEQGAVEFGKRHYPIIVLLHFFFFLFLLGEVLWFGKGISPLWLFLLPVFVITQVVRLWALFSLGKYWNTKIIVLPHATIVKKGPYRFIKHPNYLIVTIELIVIPLLFEAYFTAVTFTLLNMIILSIRIPIEENALKSLTEYDGKFKTCNRFVPKMLKKCDS